jgi:hypothetical protein
VRHAPNKRINPARRARGLSAGRESDTARSVVVTEERVGGGASMSRGQWSQAARIAVLVVVILMVVVIALSLIIEVLIR